MGREKNVKEGKEEGSKERGFQMEKIYNDESRIYGCVGGRGGGLEIAEN